MGSKRVVGVVCGILAVVMILFVCLLVAGGGFLYFNGPDIAGRISWPVTATPSPTSTLTSTPTPTWTQVPPTNTPQPTPTLTSTQVPAIQPPTPTPSPTAPPTETPVPTDTPAPTDAPSPAPTAAPTQMPTETPIPTLAAEPFLPIGAKAELSPQGSGVTGSAVLFSPRQFTVINFNYDGKCPVTDIRLGMQGFPKPPVAVLHYIEARPYNNESFDVPIPPDLPAGSANALFVYCDSRDEMLAWGPLVSPSY